MSIITFNGVNLWNRAVDGAGWKFTASPLIGEMVEVKAPLGEGYWLKPAGIEFADHTLELAWYGTSPDLFRGRVETLSRRIVANLVIPVHGTFANCRLVASTGFDSFKSDDKYGYIVQSTLTFRQYP